MGLKRLFEAEEMEDCNAKHARQLSYSHDNNNNNQLDDEAIPYHISLDKTSVLEDLNGLFGRKPTWSNDADTLSHQSSCSGFTSRPLSPVQDVYSCLMNHAPRKQIPVGSNHQADIPEYAKEVISESAGKLVGKCTIPNVSGAGLGRKECLCPDQDSSRCVRQHIMEARESLIGPIGNKRFMELGLCEMGEEVAGLWTEGEQDLFHKLAYSNPVSLGRDFWKQLTWTFPSRTMKELVSYYFNVFILRRRSIQNRSKTLEVDSDDDEWQVEYDSLYNWKSSSHEEEEEEDAPINYAHCVYMDKNSRDGEVNVEDDSCISFEFQDSNLIFPHSPTENRVCRRSRDDHDRSLAPDCWNKNNDLLPTSNIIQEILGRDEWGDNNDGVNSDSKGE